MQDAAASSGEPDIDYAKEHKALAKKHRRLTRELEYRTQLLQKTDELYRTSERVLTQAHQDLEGLIERNNAMQLELNQVSRMAAIGELSARVIHEVLNPMTAMMGRIQRALMRLKPSEDEDSLAILGEIVEDWEASFGEKTLSELVSEGERGESSDFADDLNDALTIMKALGEERKTLKDDLGFMDRTGNHMVKIINGMRSLGHSQSDEAPEDINALCRAAVELTQDALKRAGGHIVERYDSSLPKVHLVGNEIIQIMTNLLGNAQQVLDEGGTVQVETRLADERVEIRVIDDGIGIDLPDDQIDLIFEAGFTTKARKEGTGLGLSICRRFARKASGDIVVESTEVGKGTCLLLWLPRESADTHH